MSDAAAGVEGPAAAAVFGDRLSVARQYADLLADVAVQQGLIGPREVPRLWQRHLLNSAVVTDLVPDGARVVDVGSGAGLPGLAMAVRRPDLSVDLVEPMLRRCTFLTETVQALGLRDTVRVIRGRAEERSTRGTLGAVDWVVARAVAPLDRLAGWCLPLLAPGGRLLALKGTAATEEVATHRSALQRAGAGAVEIAVVGAGVLSEPTTVVIVTRAATAKRKARRT